MMSRENQPTEGSTRRRSSSAHMTQGDALYQAELWHRAGHRVVIATVLEAKGSAPCPPGSHLAINDEGDFCGSVSGGCVESDVIAEAEGLFVSGGTKVLAFGIEDEIAWRVGLPCGGSIKVLIEALEPDPIPPSDGQP